jgi:uncharacterized membrane protein
VGEARGKEVMTQTLSSGLYSFVLLAPLIIMLLAVVIFTVFMYYYLKFYKKEREKNAR